MNDCSNERYTEGKRWFPYVNSYTVVGASTFNRQGKQTNTSISGLRSASQQHAFTNHHTQPDVLLAPLFPCAAPPPPLPHSSYSSRSALQSYPPSTQCRSQPKPLHAVRRSSPLSLGFARPNAPVEGWNFLRENASEEDEKVLWSVPERWVGKVRCASLCLRRLGSRRGDDEINIAAG